MTAAAALMTMDTTVRLFKRSHLYQSRASYDAGICSMAYITILPLAVRVSDIARAKYCWMRFTANRFSRFLYLKASWTAIILPSSAISDTFGTVSVAVQRLQLRQPALRAGFKRGSTTITTILKSRRLARACLNNRAAEVPSTVARAIISGLYFGDYK